MEHVSEEESDIYDYEEKTYEQLKSGKHRVKISNQVYVCPYCPNKRTQTFHYKDLLQHASAVGSCSSKKRTARDKANHLVLAKYLEVDIAVDAGPSNPSANVNFLEEIDRDELKRLAMETQRSFSRKPHFEGCLQVQFAVDIAPSWCSKRRKWLLSCSCVTADALMVAKIEDSICSQVPFKFQALSMLQCSSLRAAVYTNQISRNCWLILTIFGILYFADYNMVGWSYARRWFMAFAYNQPYLARVRRLLQAVFIFLLWCYICDWMFSWAFAWS